jgi:flagellar basal-body rod protein FlgB
VTEASPTPARSPEAIAMAISELPIFSMLRTRMQWNQERQRVLAENVANSDTPHFRPRDLTPPSFERTMVAQVAPLQLARTDSAHQAGQISDATRFNIDRRGVFEIRPAGNAVDLEDQMMKVAATQMDYQTATSLYTRSLGLIKTALGKR